MARKAIYKHSTVVDVNTYPDDGTSPVGTTEWNADPDSAGMLGVTPATSTITIASGVATVTDSVTVVAAESGTSDVLDKLAITNTNQYDLIYLFADTGDTITLTNTSSPSADGHIQTIGGANETLSTTKPTILIRKGNYWYGYGGGTASDLDTTNFAVSAIITASETIGSNDNDTTLPTSAAVKAYVDASPVGDITSVVSGDGLTGGGTTGDVTLTVVGGTGITANANDIAIDSTVTTLTGTQTLTNKTLTAPTLTTPALGTPASGILSGCTVIPMAEASGILPDANMPNLTGAITTVQGAVDTTLVANAVDSDHYTDGSIDLAHISTGAKTQALIIAASDETTALTTGTAKATFRMPYAFTLTAIRASVTTAPTGSVATIDVNEGGSTILSTKITIDASEKTSTSAATAAVLSDTSLADDAEITIDIDGVGSTVAGTGLKVALIGYKT